jgi:hypothetical protein
MLEREQVVLCDGQPITVHEISANAEVRKKSEVLRDVADPAEARWNMQRQSGIKEHPVVQLHGSSHRPAKASNQIKERSFPCARWTENSGDWPIKRCIDLQRETGKR